MLAIYNNALRVKLPSNSLMLGLEEKVFDVRRGVKTADHGKERVCS